ncbi:hypothetical protein ACRAWD_02635 [Caulobacter segnis]
MQPTTANLGAYGHEIRNLLILAAMEVETHWRGVLVANGFTRDRPWTSDYVKLLVPMRLDQYAVGFRHYPWMDPVRPFGGWSADQPTQSLFWYDAYNGVKHNREHEFHRADLASVFRGRQRLRRDVGGAVHGFHRPWRAVRAIGLLHLRGSAGVGTARELRRLFRPDRIHRRTRPA